MQIVDLSYVRRDLNVGLLQWKRVTVMIKVLAMQKFLFLLRNFTNLFNFPREVPI